MTRAELTVAGKFAIERAIVRGWPALQAAAIDGWIARWSSGGSVRGNSVAALDFSGVDFDRALDSVVRFYHERGGVPQFTIADVAAPSDLDAELERRGWQRQGDYVTLVKDLAEDLVTSDTGAAARTSAIRVVTHAAATPAWSDIYLAGLSPDRRGIALRLVDGAPAPCVFYSAVSDGTVIASGLSVLDGPLASVQCMSTTAAARRTGAATAILAAIEKTAKAHGVQRLYLQTDAANAVAISVYARFGFRLGGGYHTRALLPAP